MRRSKYEQLRDFSDIKFTPLSASPNHVGRWMPGGYPVEKEMFQVAWYQAVPGIEYLEPRKRYSAEDICGDGLWMRLRRCEYEPHMIGRCIKYFVVHGLLPLKEANPGKSGKRLYALDLEALPQWLANRVAYGEEVTAA